MNRLGQLAKRREALVARAAEQRAQLARLAAAWRGPLSAVDWGLKAIRLLKAHPALIAASAVALALWRPRTMGRWVLRGITLWRVGRALRRIAAELNS